MSRTPETPAQRAARKAEREAQRAFDIDMIWAEWKVAYEGHFEGAIVLRWSKDEKRLVAELAADLGEEMTLRLLRHAIATWRERDRLTGYPGPKIIYAMRQDLLNELTIGGGKVVAGRNAVPARPSAAEERAQAIQARSYDSSPEAQQQREMTVRLWGRTGSMEAHIARKAAKAVGEPECQTPEEVECWRAEVQRAREERRNPSFAAVIALRRRTA